MRSKSQVITFEFIVSLFVTKLVFALFQRQQGIRFLSDRLGQQLESLKDVGIVGMEMT
jgi:hypothetical protein